MNEAQGDPQIKKAIEDGEIIVNEHSRMYQIIVDTLGARTSLNEKDSAGDMLSRKKKALGHKARLEYLGYTEKPKDIDQLRAMLTEEQRKIINAILAHFLDERFQYSPWIRSGILDHVLGYEEGQIKNILKPLGGSIAYENPNTGEGDRFVLTPLGFLLTERGEDIEIVLAKYLEYIRQQFIDSFGVGPRISLQKMSEAKELTADQLTLLRRVLIWFNDFFGGGGSVDDHTYPLCIDKLVRVKDLRTYIRNHEFCKYNPDIPIVHNPLIDYRIQEMPKEKMPLDISTNELEIPTASAEMKAASKVFISYAWKDKAIMKYVKGRLESFNIDFWVDQDGIRAGQSFPSRISEAIKKCDTVIVLWSTNADQSEWVRKELDAAQAQHKRIIPCPLDDTEIPALLTPLLFADFREDLDEGIEQLISALTISENDQGLQENKNIASNKAEPKNIQEVNRPFVHTLGRLGGHSNANEIGFEVIIKNSGGFTARKINIYWVVYSNQEIVHQSTEYLPVLEDKATHNFKIVLRGDYATKIRGEEINLEVVPELKYESISGRQYFYREKYTVTKIMEHKRLGESESN